MFEQIESLYNEIWRSGRKIEEIYSINEITHQLLVQYINDKDELIKTLEGYSDQFKKYVENEINKVRSDVRYNQTFTITFGDQAENHVGMLKLGNLAESGFNFDDLKKANEWFKMKGVATDFLCLNPLIDGVGDEAYLLIARDGASVITDINDLYAEQDVLEKDTKAYMYGRVVNKKARYNLCFGNNSQEPNYEEKSGRIVAFKDVKLLNHVRETLPEIVGDKGRSLVAEGNYYYNLRECGIGYHGDSERKIVVGIRLGASFPLHFQWFFKREKVGNVLKLVLNHGDIYFMSSKTVGTDLKKLNIYTLRHAAGCPKYTNC